MPPPGGAQGGQGPHGMPLAPGQLPGPPPLAGAPGAAAALQQAQRASAPGAAAAAAAPGAAAPGAAAGGTGPPAGAAGAAAAQDAPLAPGWTEHRAPDGRTYYHHKESKKSAWVRPVAEAAKPEPAKARAHCAWVCCWGSEALRVTPMKFLGFPTGAAAPPQTLLCTHLHVRRAYVSVDSRVLCTLPGGTGVWLSSGHSVHHRGCLKRSEQMLFAMCK